MMTATFTGKLTAPETAMRNAYIISLYDSGKTAREIIEATKMPQSTVYACLKAYFEEHPEKMRPTCRKVNSRKKLHATLPTKALEKSKPETIRKMERNSAVVGMYLKGASYSEIVKATGCCRETIRKILDDEGISRPIRGQSNSQRFLETIPPKTPEITDADIEKIARRVAEILAAKIAA